MGPGDSFLADSLCPKVCKRRKRKEKEARSVGSESPISSYMSMQITMSGTASRQKSSPTRLASHAVRDASYAHDASDAVSKK